MKHKHFISEECQQYIYYIILFFLFQRTCKKNPHINPQEVNYNFFFINLTKFFKCSHLIYFWISRIFFFLSKVQQDAPSPYEKYTRRQRHYSLSRTQSVRETSTDLGRPLRALSRQNSFSSLRRSESFYSGNAHASMTLGRSAYSGTDYASAVRRTSLFDGYAGFSLYSSIRYIHMYFEGAY